MLDDPSWLRESLVFPVDRMARAKRADNLIVAIALLILTLPVTLLSAISTKLVGPVPVFFRQPRRGRNGHITWIWNFRSMYAEDFDDLSVRQSTRGDPRTTRVGAVLRRHSIDELPQLFSVIRGEMSVVGPGPHPLATSVDGRLLEEVAVSYPMRCSVKLGITGWAQTNGCLGHLDTIADRVEYDLVLY
jgi:lipopolysaccharide/colanic/teichoic acid biosynthesis glycosyltransferase